MPSAFTHKRATIAVDDRMVKFRRDQQRRPKLKYCDIFDTFSNFFVNIVHHHSNLMPGGYCFAVLLFLRFPSSVYLFSIIRCLPPRQPWSLLSNVLYGIALGSIATVDGRTNDGAKLEKVMLLSHSGQMGHGGSLLG